LIEHVGPQTVYGRSACMNLANVGRYRIAAAGVSI
jgi:hypothetical protein